MRFNLERPDMRKVLAGIQLGIERAVTSGMRDASNELKERLREDVVASGLGERLSRTWRGKVFPEVADTARLNTQGLAAANRRKTCRSTVIVFLLVPQVTLKKRLNIDAIAKRQSARVPALIARHWRQ
jgi:hypothetical protein